MPKGYMALVKWVGGKFDNTYTSGIPIDWIENFDRKKFTHDAHDKAYDLEWRVGKLNKWKKHRVNVILISGIETALHNFIYYPKTNLFCNIFFFITDKFSVLQKHLEELDGIKSPRTVPSSTSM